ncbi:MAG: dihydrodipicolinate synthase family protein [Aureliella sp.]
MPSETPKAHQPLDSRQSGFPRLRGIIPPLVTPLKDRDTLNHDGLARLLEHVIAGGVSGVFILGTTGEAPSLSYRLRRELIEETCRIVNSRIPVLVGVTDTAFVETIQLADCAAAAGATGVVLSTPYYFPAGQTEFGRYIGEVERACPLPIMLYNIPSLTKVPLELDTLRRAAELDSIVGVKDSGGDQDYFEQVLTLKSERPDWSILIGPEHLTAWSVQKGGDGGVNGGANIFPHLFSQLFTAADSGDQRRIDALSSVVDRLQDIYSVGKYASRFIKATKCGVSLVDVCPDRLAEPFNHFLAPQREQVAAIIADVQERLDRTL